MTDLVFVAILAGLTALSYAFVRLCDVA